MNSVAKYLRIYRTYFAMGFSRGLSFRLHFFLEVGVTLSLIVTALAGVSFMYDHVSRIGPWNESEFLFFLSFLILLNHIQMSFIAESYWNLPILIRRGDLDFLLVKPVSTPFAMLFDHVRASGVCTLWLPLGLVVHYGIQSELALLSWLLLPVLLLLGLSLRWTIEFLIILGIFWVYEGIGLNYLRMQLQSVGQWPDFVYLEPFRSVFFILFPVLLIASAPVRFLFDASAWPLLLGVVTAIIVFSCLDCVVWRMALRRYESASS